MIDICKHISELLYENETVALPELGSFVSSYRPAGIDVVLGLLSPPARQIDFNPYLILDDGMLASRIAERHRLSLEEATSLIATFTENIQKTLALKELVLLPEIGKLYSDYQGELRFMPDTTNYNLQVFGLPDVKFYPVFRSRESRVLETLSADMATVPELTTSTSVPAGRSFALPANYQKLAIPTAAVFLLTVSLVAWLWWGISSSGGSNNPFNQKVSQVRVNEKPTISSDGIGYQELPPIHADPELKSETPPATASPKGDDHYLSKEKKETLPDYKEDAAAIVPEKKFATVIIGSFRDKSNIRKLVADIHVAGYDDYQDKVPNGLTRVGIKVGYRDRSDLNRQLGRIRSKYNRGAFVKK